MDNFLDKPTIDLSKRKAFNNSDGTIYSIMTTSFNVDGKEYVVPTVLPDGTKMDAKQAFEHFMLSGEHLGSFKTVDEATSYAKKLSNAQGQRYNANSGAPAPR